MKKPSSLASLLTLAAGSAALPVTADAAIVYTNLSASPITVGFGGGQSASYVFNLPGSTEFQVLRSGIGNSYRIIANQLVGFVGIGRQSNSRSATNAGTNVAFRTNSGANWNAAARNGSATFGNIIRSSGSSVKATAGPGAFSMNKYLLFKFENSTAGGQVQYGWVGMSNATITPGSYTNMSVTLTGWAYDDTGAVINAGATSIPEPGTAGLVMGGALVLGAVGLRRSRKRNGSPAATVSDLIA